MRNKRKFTEFQHDEIRRKLGKGKEQINDLKAYNRVLALRMYSQGKSNKEISEVVDFSVQYISELVTKYLSEGMDAIIADKRTSNNRRMSVEEEKAFLEQFIEMSEAGQLVNIKVILQKFEEVTGKPSATSTIYDLLKRHGWRKLKPRPEHPGKAGKEEIESSKKLTENTGGCWKNLQEVSETSLRSTKT